MNLFSNPEFLRYARSQLRTNKLIITALICVVLSLTIGFAALHGRPASGFHSAGRDLVEIAFILQALVLAAGGGIAVLNSIYSEKEQNTFDYQRITRMSPLELALGKLFGAPILMYFICLCLAPFTLVAAFIAEAKPSLVLAAYVVLVVASVAFHSFTLLLSMVSVKGSQVSGILLALLLLWLASVEYASSYLQIHPLGPFEAQKFATAVYWGIHAPVKIASGYSFAPGSFSDVFFGRLVHHFPVLVIVDLLLAFWFLLAVVRNIKRDPQRYEIYSPMQFLGFALFLNFLFVGFYNPGWATPLDAQSLFLTYDLALFFLLGVALLRNRERARSLPRAPGRLSSPFWNSFWPAPILGLGTLLAGAMIVAALNHAHSSVGAWSLGFAFLRSLCFTLWVVADLQILQCLNLRPGKHPLVMGVLYLFIYYVCACIILGASGCFQNPHRMPIGSLFVPSAIYLLEPKTWAEAPNLWAAGFTLQAALILALFYIQNLQLRRLQASLPTTPPN